MLILERFASGFAWSHRIRNNKKYFWCQFCPRSRLARKMPQLPQTSSRKKWKTSFLSEDKKVELVIFRHQCNLHSNSFLFFSFLFFSFLFFSFLFFSFLFFSFLIFSFLFFYFILFSFLFFFFSPRKFLLPPIDSSRLPARRGLVFVVVVALFSLSFVPK